MQISIYFLLVIIFIQSCTFLYGNNTPSFTLNTALNYALNSKQSQLVQLKSDSIDLEMDIYLGIYDIKTTHTMELSNDTTKKSSPFFPQSTEQTLRSNVQKTFLSGTTISGTTTLSNLNYTYPSNKTLDKSFSTSSLELAITQAFYGAGTKTDHHNALLTQKNKQEQDLLMILDQTEDLIFTTTMDYWTLVQTKLTVDTYQNDLKTAKELLTINKNKARSGLIEDRIIFALQAATIEKEQALHRVQSTYQNLLETMSIQLSIPKETITINSNIESLETMLRDLPLPTTLATESSVSKNRLIQHAQLNTQSKQLSYLTYTQSEKPAVSIYGKYTRNNLDESITRSSRGILSENNYLIEAGLSVDMPLLSQSNFAKTQKAKNEVKISRFELALLKDKVILSERKTSNQVQHLKHEIDLSKKNLFWRQKKYQNDESFFKSGRLDIDVLLKSKTELTYAELNYTNTVVNYAKAITQWYRIHNQLLDHVHTSIITSQEPSL